MELSQISKEPECKIKPMRKNQKDWINYFNQKGMKMISASDIYQIAKQEHKELIESLSKDFKEGFLITSTKIIYNKDNLNAEIIHDADSTVVKPTLINVKVPSVWNKLPNDKEAEAYLQSLFNTPENLDEIKQIIKRFDKNKNMCLWTPSQSSRAAKQERSVLLYFSLGRFDLDGYYWVGYASGLSRGVNVASAKQTRKKEGDAK